MSPILEPRADRLADLRDQLAGRADVSSASIDESRFPSRLMVAIKATAITDGIHDLLTAYNATVLHAAADASTDPTDGRPSVFIEVGIEPTWREIGIRSLRKWGESSVAITFPHEALEVAGLDAGDEVTIEVREHEIKLSKESA